MRRTFTPNSSLDSEVDLNASYLENAILVTGDWWLQIEGFPLIIFHLYSCGEAATTIPHSSFLIPNFYWRHFHEKVHGYEYAEEKNP